MDMKQSGANETALTEKVQELKDQLVDVEDDYQTSKDENAKLQALLANLKAENAALTARLAEVQNDLMTIDGQRQAAVQKSIRLKKEKQSAEQMAEFCDDERIEALNDLNEAKKTIAQRDETIHSQQATIQYFHIQMMTVQINLQQSQMQLAQSQQNYHNLLAAHLHLLEQQEAEDAEANNEDSDIDDPEVLSDADSDA